MSDDVGTVWIPDYVNPGRTTSFTGFGIDPTPYGHRGYIAYRLVPVDPEEPEVPVVSPRPNQQAEEQA